jgi:hypothetical protein
MNELLKKMSTASLLAVPKDAHNAEVLTEDDGSVVLRWFDGPDDDADEDADAADFWSVTLSADRRTVDVQHKSEWPALTPSVLETLKYVLQYQSGLNVNLTVGGYAANDLLNHPRS